MPVSPAAIPLPGASANPAAAYPEGPVTDPVTDDNPDANTRIQRGENLPATFSYPRASADRLFSFASDWNG